MQLKILLQNVTRRGSAEAWQWWCH